MLSCRIAFTVRLSEAVKGLVGGETAYPLVLVMLPLVLGRAGGGVRGGTGYAGSECSTPGVEGGDQGRWNCPGGRFWKGLGKRSGVQTSLLKGWPSTAGSRCGGGGGVRGRSSCRRRGPLGEQAWS